MKKVYLLFMMVSFTVALFAQSARPTMTLQQAKNQTVTKKLDPTMSTPKLTNSAVPTRGTSGLVVSPDYIGSTYQEQQTNYNQHNKISVFPDGTASAVWMTAPYNGAATLRGTGYNYFDGTQWVNAYDDIQRIEDVRTSQKLLQKVEDAIKTGGVEKAKELCRDTKGPLAAVFYQGLDRYDEGLDSVEKALVSYGGVQMAKLETNLTWK